ncbi:MAG: multiple sugar transport system ATP-binding protein, partial [Gaiellales bacterium]|nr:multiple sugar transport system ATP-binding protein [Gaiellales bacterium]
MSGIVLEHVRKVFSGDVVAVDDVSVEIAEGEFLVLVGPSGCGKSTLLRMIAGLEEVTGGGISIDGRDVTDLPPRARDIALVFQTYALYPHMTVRQNLGYGLKVRKTDKQEAVRRVDEVADMLGLETL